MKRVLLISLVILIASCRPKKETDVEPEIPNVDPVVKYDTVKSKSYFPTYPKSIWYYKNSKGNEIIHQTDSGYVLSSEPEVVKIYSKPAYVAKYDGRTMNGYDVLLSPGKPAPWFSLLPQIMNVGADFLTQDTKPNYSKAVTEAIDTTVTVNGIDYSSVVIIGYYVLLENNKDPLSNKHYEIDKRVYYAKNIGIIKQQDIDANTQIIDEEEVLVKYTIGK